VKSATAEDRTSLAKAMKVFLIAVLALGGDLFAAPAMADSVGEDFENQVSGNVRNEGTPLSGVRIISEGNGYSAETVTDGDGKWSIGVPEAGTYEITLVEDTLPDGIAVLEGGSTQTIEWGFTNSVVWNFFIGEAERNPTSQLDQFFMRVFAGVNFGLLLGLAAIGLSLVFGTTALPNFAHGEMVTMGALFTLFLTLAGVPLLLSFPIAVALSALFGWGLDAAVWAPLRARGVGIVQLMIVSIGLSLTFRYITQAFLGGGTEQLPGALGSPEIPIFRTVTLSVNDLVSMGVSLVVLVAFAFWLLRSKMGKATRAVSDNADLAAASGINVDQVIRVVWIMAGALAGLAGILWAYFRPGLKWDMGEKILLFIFAAGVLGGLGTAFGAFVGAMVVGVLIETSAQFIPSDLKYVGALVVMIVILLFRPQGILGRPERIG